MTSPSPLRNSLFWIPVLSGGAIAFLIWQVYFQAPPEEEATWVSSLPAWFSSCNAMSASFVIAGLLFIKKGQERAHVLCMLTALGFSAVFLGLYVTYNHLHGDTAFPGQGAVRPVYFGILISHVLLSMVSLPLVLTTFWLALSKRWTAHRRLAKITAPIWLYVSFTGVAVFLFQKAYA